MSGQRHLKTEFSRFVSKGVTLVDFNAPWCKPCRKQETILKTIEKRYRSTAHVRAFNVDKNQDIALNLGIQSVPTLIIYKDGKEMKRFIGLQPAETLDQALQAVLGQNH